MRTMAGSKARPRPRVLAVKATVIWPWDRWDSKDIYVGRRPKLRDDKEVNPEIPDSTPDGRTKRQNSMMRSEFSVESLSGYISDPVFEPPPETWTFQPCIHVGKVFICVCIFRLGLRRNEAIGNSDKLFDDRNVRVMHPLTIGLFRFYSLVLHLHTSYLNDLKSWFVFIAFALGVQTCILCPVSRKICTQGVLNSTQ